MIYHHHHRAKILLNWFKINHCLHTTILRENQFFWRNQFLPTNDRFLQKSSKNPCPTYKGISLTHPLKKQSNRLQKIIFVQIIVCFTPTPSSYSLSLPIYLSLSLSLLIPPSVSITWLDVCEKAKLRLWPQNMKKNSRRTWSNYLTAKQIETKRTGKAGEIGQCCHSVAVVVIVLMWLS